MATPAQMFTQNADLDVARRQQQHNLERAQQQNTVGAMLLDAVNQSANIKPTMKDENGNVVPNPAYAQAQEDRRKLLGQYVSLNSPEQHASFGQHLHGLIFGKPTDQKMTPALNPSTPEPQAAPATGAPGQPVPTSAETAPIHPMAAAPPDHPLHAITKGIKTLGEHLSAFANPLPPTEQPDKDLMAKYYRDPTEVAAERQYQREQDLAETRGKWAVEAAKARGLNVRPVHMGDVTPRDAIKNMNNLGYVYVQEDGTPYTEEQLAEMPDSFRLGEFRQGATTFAKAYDQKAGHVGVGGIEYAVYPLGEQGPRTMTELGTQTSALPKTHEVPGMNPGEKIELTTKPAETPGMVTPPAAVPATVAPPAPAGEPPNPVLKTRPVVTPTLPPAPSQKAAVDKVNAKRSQSRQVPQPTGMPIPPPFAPGTMLQQGRSAQPVVSAMSVMAANVFGGDGEPPIWEYAKMYDNPELRTALNKALTLNALANPGTEDNPSFLQTLATAVGVTGWSQEQVNQANVEARQNLERLGGPDALKMFAREAALQEDLSALRTATKASAAQGSIRTLVRAAPVYNVSSSQNFRDQLGATLNTATASMRGYPAINPEYMKWWERGVSAAKGGPVSANAPKGPSPQRPANVPEGYVFKENGPKGKGWYAPTSK